MTTRSFTRSLLFKPIDSYTCSSVQALQVLKNFSTDKMFKSELPLRVSSRAFICLCIISFSTFSLTIWSRTASAEKHGPINIGAIIDVSTRIGREEKIAMDIATQELNKLLGDKINLFLYVNDSGGKPQLASVAADYLLKENQVQAILGMDTWLEAVSVAEVSEKAEVPVLTFATSLITLPQMSTRWPFLVRMDNNDYEEMRCVASIVGSYQWRRVIVIYEHNGYSSESGIQALLSVELRDVGSEVEYWLAIPPLYTLSDPKTYIGEELEKLDNKPSRVFIVIGCSLEMVLHIVIEAKDIGLLGKHSVLITTSSVTNLFHSVKSSVLSSLKGVIGIKTHFSKINPRFLNFSIEFTERIRKMYPDEDKSEPGIYALRAYDSIAATASALASLTNHSHPSSGKLLGNILSSNFAGLSGEIQFENGESSHSSTYEIINVLDSSYKELKFWSSEYGFSDNPIYELSGRDIKKRRGNYAPMQVLGSSVLWPGRLKTIPVGREMAFSALPQQHDIEKPAMVIGLPGKQIEEFVKCREDGEEFTGYCIDVFKEAIRTFNFTQSYKFECHNGTYSELVEKVYYKRYDAAVGDITILANRSRYVDFTQPYMESSLTMVAPVKVEKHTWLFVKPFTGWTWLLIFSVFLYTMFVVWILEHRSNPEFKGTRVNQLSTALWFTFCTLFFAHREGIRSNYTRTVMFVWFCAVFVFASSYPASLTTILTLQHLKPIVTDIYQLKNSNASVGCDGSSFYRKYLEDILEFPSDKIINIMSVQDYLDAFNDGTISATFMELPYARFFISKFNHYRESGGHKDRFGGFGFAFPLGSPLAKQFSEAFLTLSEDGTLKKLEEKWFPPNFVDSSSQEDIESQRLVHSNFVGISFVTMITSAAILVLYFIAGCLHERTKDSANTGQPLEENDVPHSSPPRNGSRLTSLDAASLNNYYTPQRDFEMAEIHNEVPDNQTRPLRQTTSLPVNLFH